MKSNLNSLQSGFLMNFPDPSLNLFEDIERLKKEKKAKRGEKDKKRQEKNLKNRLHTYRGDL